MTHAHFIVMGGFAIKTRLGCQRVSPDCFVRLVNDGTIKLWNNLEADILDKNKASSQTKFVACIQLLWFFTQLLARAIKALPITPLEWFTLAVVICSLISYGFWWKKPLDVYRPIILDMSSGVDNGQNIELSKVPTNVSTANPRYTPQRRWNLVPLYFDPYGKSLSVVTMTVVPIFAACHIAAWDWSFPSRAEQVFWRTSSLTCLVLPTIFSLAAWASAWCRKNVVIIPLVGLYVMIRTCMVVEIFASLRSVPQGVYSAVNLRLPHF
jgi:hypothetical protein